MKIEVQNGWKVFGISPKQPNNVVMYWDSRKKKKFAMVKQIYQFDNGSGGVEQAVLVEPILDVFPKALDGPSRNFWYYLHLMGCIVGELKVNVTFLLNVNDVKAVVAYRKLPPHTFGLARGGMILKPIDL
ncbi:uncharacterized protein MELLADRAFT_95283 [Melampsora larici-populina 98AG31]|uniref:Uncharacterized protein n=1 Tax=Melampsora larici-populina (strain 98AG31 / pathotype 3-4-7) TaxID=747676 RepID=F4RCW0_MELLP|nr:uncharacterized protein MELLADRAFT_95283 [Melampsora larici-populina 98AG31]EGG09792.1 hypothetical protein MELLADRAFT_95283 [Melampsora larici-populina 98AG31]